MSVASRVKQIIESQGCNKSDFADKIGIDRTTIAHMIKNDSYPRSNVLTAIAVNFPTINTRWLLTGEGEMWLKPEPDPPVKDENWMEPEEAVKYLRMMLDSSIAQNKRLLKDLAMLREYIEELKETETAMYKLHQKIGNTIQEAVQAIK